MGSGIPSSYRFDRWEIFMLLLYNISLQRKHNGCGWSTAAPVNSFEIKLSWWCLCLGLLSLSPVRCVIVWCVRSSANHLERKNSNVFMFSHNLNWNTQQRNLGFCDRKYTISVKAILNPLCVRALFFSLKHKYLNVFSTKSAQCPLESLQWIRRWLFRSKVMAVVFFSSPFIDLRCQIVDLSVISHPMKCHSNLSRPNLGLCFLIIHYTAIPNQTQGHFKSIPLLDRPI